MSKLGSYSDMFGYLNICLRVLESQQTWTLSHRVMIVLVSMHDASKVFKFYFAWWSLAGMCMIAKYIFSWNKLTQGDIISKYNFNELDHTHNISLLIYTSITFRLHVLASNLSFIVTVWQSTTCLLGHLYMWIHIYMNLVMPWSLNDKKVYQWYGSYKNHQYYTLVLSKHF